MRDNLHYPEVQFPEITSIHNRVYYTTYIRLLPQRYERIIRKVKSLLTGRLKSGR